MDEVEDSVDFADKRKLEEIPTDKSYWLRSKKLKPLELPKVNNEADNFDTCGANDEADNLDACETNDEAHILDMCGENDEANNLDTCIASHKERNLDMCQANEKVENVLDELITQNLETLSDEEESDKLEDADGEDPYKLRFEFTLPDEKLKDRNCLYKKEKKESWIALGDLFMTDSSSADFELPLTLKKKEELEDFHLKSNLVQMCKSSKLLNTEGCLTSLQSEFLSIISNYVDLLFTCRSHENSKALRAMYCLHALNHILKAKAKIIRHNSKLSKNPNDEYRDQGYTRPVVLMLVPFKEDCYQIVKTLSSLLTNNVLNKKRFEKDYGSEKPLPRKNPKPEDFEKTFSGNVDEDFKIGLKIKNRSITLYAEFYSAELIIASPLGLRRIIGAEGDKKRDFDFLSSIEILIVDRGDIFMMQNWYHFNHILKHLNLLPKENHGCNFFRIRNYALSGLAKYYRQTIFISSVEHDWFKAIFYNGQCCNYAGYVRTCPTLSSASICQVVVSMPQIFRWFDSKNQQSEIDDRFEFFVSKVLPQYKDPAMIRTLIYVPSYVDFVRLRNYFRSQEISCAMVCEYTKSGKIAQARDLFFKGHRHFMLYTERAHFYHRYKIKGIQHIIFYQLPTYPHFYQEMCNVLLYSNPGRKNDWFTEMTCTVIVSKFDCLQLKHTVGVERTTHMLNSKKEVFMIQSKC